MSRFDFTHDALDVAIRRLLMDITLPRETQQIDRVIEAFAQRYEECEPDLFPSKGEMGTLDSQLTYQTPHMF
jgi:Sec7-like guanine-nucleotide exchange factor